MDLYGSIWTYMDLYGSIYGLYVVYKPHRQYDWHMPTPAEVPKCPASKHCLILPDQSAVSWGTISAELEQTDQSFDDGCGWFW